MTATNFSEALRLVLKHEGGYVDHPKDPSGELTFPRCSRAPNRSGMKTRGNCQDGGEDRGGGGHSLHS
jgi:hypothetical protein